MANKYVDKIYKLLTKNKLIVIIIIILGVAGTLYSFWPKEEFIDTSNNEIIIQNSTLTQSPVFQKSQNISVTYSSPPESDIYSPFYSQELSVNFDKPVDGKKYDYYYIKFILPDDQEVFLEQVFFNTTYKIASCNEDSTDCYIYHKYRNKGEIKEEDVCWIFTTRFGHQIGTDHQNGSLRFEKNPSECSKLVVD